MSNYWRSLVGSSLVLLIGSSAGGCADTGDSTPAEGVNEVAEAVLYQPTWTTKSTAFPAHQDGAAVLMANGSVLLTNGRNDFSDIYNPVTNTVTPGTPNWMAESRTDLTAALLPSGNIVISCGFYPTFYGDSWVYHPTTDQWTSGGVVSPLSIDHAAVTLQDGRAMITGGTDLSGSQYFIHVFNEAAGSWPVVGNMIKNREAHAAVVLTNGRVLDIGGSSVPYHVAGASTVLSSAELFNPTTNTSTLTGSMATARASFTATRLSNGKVLVAGGTDGTTTFSSSELYDPATGTWSATGSLALARTRHFATLLQDGRVLVVGGASTTATELYDPATGTWSAGSPMNLITNVYSATALADGRVLVTGTAGGAGIAEIYNAPQCVTFQRGTFGTTADTQIGANSLTKNFGTSAAANTGFVGGAARQTLLSFDLSPIPAGSTIASSTLTLSASTVPSPSSTVEVHRITAPWAETTVTWSSFAGAYDPTIDASFASGAAPGLRSADVTGLVQDWRSGATTNYGVLLTQPGTAGFTSYNTADATPVAVHPALSVCYVAP
jgi:galactose oxidase-like protein